jgi:type II secretory pathway component PulF
MSDRGSLDGASGRLTARDAADLSSQVAGLTRAGLPLAQGLQALSEELPRGRLKRSILDLAKTLERGTPLDQAVNGHDNHVPPHLRGLVAAGMRSGEMGDLLDRFSDHLRVGTELKRKLWLSLAYPVLTISIALTLFVLICVFVVSQFESVYGGFGIPVPAVTLALIAVARVVNSNWVSAGILITVCCCGLLAARLLCPRPLRRSLAARLPLVGAVWRSTSLAEFCHLLALLLESRLPLPEALRLTGEGVEDADINAACGRLANQVESGRSLAESMAERELFPVGLPRLLRWAESHKSLPEVLHMAGSMLEARARSQATFVGIVLNFLCVLLIFSLALIVPALVVPLITLISRLSG